MTTTSANKSGLRGPVASGDKAADGTALARVARVHRDNAAAQRLGFVCEEAFELCERPGVKTALRFTPSCFHPLPNVRQVLDHDSRTCRDAVQDRLAEYVVAIASEAVFTPRETPQVPFGTWGAIRLQFPFETEPSFADFAPAFLPVQTTIRSDRRARDAKVNPEGLSTVGKLNVVQFQDDVQDKPALAEQQVGSGNVAVCGKGRIIRQSECQKNSARHCGKVDDAFQPVNSDGVTIVARRAKHRLWAVDFAAFLGKRESRLEGFRCLLPCLDMQVGVQLWVMEAAFGIRQAMECRHCLPGAASLLCKQD